MTCKHDSEEKPKGKNDPKAGTNLEIEYGEEKLKKPGFSSRHLCAGLITYRHHGLDTALFNQSSKPFFFSERRNMIFCRGVSRFPFQIHHFQGKKSKDVAMMIK